MSSLLKYIQLTFFFSFLDVWGKRYVFFIYWKLWVNSGGLIKRLANFPLANQGVTHFITTVWPLPAFSSWSFSNNIFLSFTAIQIFWIENTSKVVKNLCIVSHAWLGLLESSTRHNQCPPLLFTGCRIYHNQKCVRRK